MARRRVLILLSVTFLLEVGIYLVLTRLPPTFIAPFSSIAWAVGVIAPSTALVHVLALTIGSSTSAEEYELGTADYWFTRPISRHTYFLGKILGGFSLVTIMITTYSLTALSISWYVFGPQTRVEGLPAAILSTAVSAVPFFAIGVVMGEVLRRSMLATIFSGTVFFASALIESYANIVATIGDDPTLLEAIRFLPTWAAAGLPVTVITESLGLRLTAPFFFLSGIGMQNVWLGFLNLFLYSAVSFTIGWVKFRYSDVTKRAQ